MGYTDPITGETYAVPGKGGVNGGDGGGPGEPGEDAGTAKGGQGLSGRTRSDKDTYSGSYVSGIWFSSEVNGNVTFGDSGGGGAGGNGENGTNSSGSTSIIVRFNDSNGSS